MARAAVFAKGHYRLSSSCRFRLIGNDKERKRGDGRGERRRNDVKDSRRRRRRRHHRRRFRRSCFRVVKRETHLIGVQSDRRCLSRRRRRRRRLNDAAENMCAPRQRSTDTRGHKPQDGAITIILPESVVAMPSPRVFGCPRPERGLQIDFQNTTLYYELYAIYRVVHVCRFLAKNEARC